MLARSTSLLTFWIVVTARLGTNSLSICEGNDKIKYLNLNNIPMVYMTLDPNEKGISEISSGVNLLYSSKAFKQEVVQMHNDLTALVSSWFSLLNTSLKIGS
jgi:hypothetical protein